MTDKQIECERTDRQMDWADSWIENLIPSEKNYEKTMDSFENNRYNNN